MLSNAVLNYANFSLYPVSLSLSASLSVAVCCIVIDTGGQMDTDVRRRAHEELVRADAMCMCVALLSAHRKCAGVRVCVFANV